MTLTVIRGDDEVLALSVVDADGVPVNLTTAELWFTVKRKLSDPDSDAIIQKTTGAGIEHEAEAGSATIYLEPSDTEGLAARQQTFRFDVQLKEQDGRISTILRDYLTVKPDVTIETDGS